MTKDLPPSKKAEELLQEAWKAEERALLAKEQAQEDRINKEVNIALDLIDEAILTMEKAGLDPYFYKAQKEIFLITISFANDFSPKKFSGLTETMEEALKKYIEQRNIIRQIETHISLAGTYINLNEKQRASDHIQKVEILFSKIKSGGIEEYSLEDNILPMEIFLQLRQSEVARLKKFIPR